MLNILFTGIISLMLLGYAPTQARSVFRPQDPYKPKLSVAWENKHQQCTLESYYLQEYPLFGIFDQEHFFNNYLPVGPIHFRNDENKSVDGTTISLLIDDLLEEINQKKKLHKFKRAKEFKHFSILRKRNFNRKKKNGFMILKCKDYPFVVKLSIETPESFTQPFTKGFDPLFFFFMAGGTNRHLSGFTRIKNADYVRNCIAQAPNLNVEFDIPRKWFYIPKNCPWLELKGKNIGKNKHLSTSIPGTYCIIADAIEFDHKFTLTCKNDREISMKLCNLVNFYIDPHIDNFMVEKETNKVVIIDTEHFPTITGLGQVDTVYTNQFHWYVDLAFKCIDDLFLRDKSKRKDIAMNGAGQLKL